MYFKLFVTVTWTVVEINVCNIKATHNNSWLINPPDKEMNVKSNLDIVDCIDVIVMAVLTAV